MAKMNKRTIFIRYFPYTDGEGKRRHARQGETVKLSVEDEKRGESCNAFCPLPSSQQAADPEVVDASDMTDDQLTEWVSKSKVNDVVKAGVGSLDLANRLLAAEERATNGDTRQGVLKGLTVVIQRAAQEAEPT